MLVTQEQGKARLDCRSQPGLGSKQLVEIREKRPILWNSRRGALWGKIKVTDSHREWVIWAPWLVVKASPCFADKLALKQGPTASAWATEAEGVLGE